MNRTIGNLYEHCYSKNVEWVIDGPEIQMLQEIMVNREKFEEIKAVVNVRGMYYNLFQL